MISASLRAAQTVLDHTLSELGVCRIEDAPEGRRLSPHGIADQIYHVTLALVSREGMTPGTLIDVALLIRLVAFALSPGRMLDESPF